MLMASLWPTMDGLAHPFDGSSEYTSMNLLAATIAVTVLPIGEPYSWSGVC